MIDGDSLRDNYSSSSLSGYASLIQEYAERLRCAGELEEQILTNVAIKIHQYLLEQPFSDKENDFLQLSAQAELSPELMVRLKQSFQGYFSQEFWESQAQWILEALEQWRKDKFIPGNNYEHSITANSLLTEQEVAIEKQLQNYCCLYSADELLQHSNVYDLSKEELVTLFNYYSPSVITEPPLFLVEPIEAIPTCPPYRAGLECTYRLDKWVNNENNWAEFKLTDKSTYRNKVQVYISEPNGIDFLPLATALQVLDGLGLEAAKLQLVFGAYLAKQERPWKDEVLLRGTELIELLGWGKRKDLTESDKLQQIANLAHGIGRLVMQSEWQMKVGNKSYDLSSTLISPLWFLSIEVIRQLNCLKSKNVEYREVHIKLRAGDWASKWFNKAGNKAKEALHQFGYLAQEILRIDPYHDELALKLAIHLSILSRIRANNKNPYPYSVSTLLRAVEIGARLRDACQDKRKAYELRRRWDKALKMLMELGWQIEFDQDYPEWLRPSNQAEKPEGWQSVNGKRVKLIDRLMAAHLFIKPPNIVQEKLLKINQRKKPLPKRLPSVSRGRVTGEQIRKEREAKEVSQAALALWMAKTPAWLCQIEKGRRKLSPKDAKELLKGIDFLAQSQTSE